MARSDTGTSPAPRGRKSPPREPERRAKRRSPEQQPKKPRKPTAAARPVGQLRQRAARVGRRLLLLATLVGVAVLAVDVAMLWRTVGARMEGRVHDEPARLTGRVPRLAPGDAATAAGWRRIWLAAGYQEVAHVQGPRQFQVQRTPWEVRPPNGDTIEIALRGRTVASLRQGGRALDEATFSLPAVSLLTDDGRERRTVVPLTDIPQSLQRAVIAIEDERFYRHHGVDPRGVLRAAFSNLTGGGVRQGGSTLTQQLAKNMFLNAERTLARKAQEALIALILEVRYDKDRLLEAYLNEIYLGQRDGFAVLGMAEASRAWFGKELSALRLDEAALLAGAIHAPNRTTPWKHPDEARRRRDIVLRKMQALGAAEPDALDAALARPVTAVEQRASLRRAPWFVDAVVERLGDRYAPEALHRDGLELVVTLDPLFQDAAEAAVERGAARLGGGPSVALVALDPRDGSVRAMVGGADYGRSQFNRVTDALRQPGSAFKPVVLAAAIAQRWPHLGPHALVSDEPLAVPGAGPGGSTWRPRNHDGRFLGPIPLRQAVALSRNPPFVRLAQDVGLERVARMAEALGIREPLRPLPSLAIGGQEVTPLSLASVYATLAAGGTYHPPRLLEGVRARDGGWLERHLPEPRLAIEPRVAAVVTALLEGVIDDGTARGVRSAGFDLPAAGKTGTTNDERDAWMAGYTADLAVVVWVGYDEGRSLGRSSTEAAVPIWTDFMKAVAPFLSGERFPRPHGLLDAPPAPPAPADLIDEDAARRAAEAAVETGLAR